MTSKNRYFRRSKISEAKFRQIVRHFALDLTATECAALTGISLRSINTIHLRIRGRRAFGKTIVFGLLKREGCVYTEIVPNASKATLQAMIRGKADIGSVIHTDGWPG